MTLVPINLVDDRLAGLPRLMSALRALPGTARVTVMIHGYRYAPGRPGSCPHDHIFSLAPKPGNLRVISWPRHLGTGPDHVCIGFGWDGSGGLWQAWHRSAQAGTRLAQVIDLIAASGHKVDLFAHSLGARVALAGLAQAGAGSVGKAILIAPAEFLGPARVALASPAGHEAQVLSAISGENAVFDRCLGWLVVPHRWGEQSLGLGLDRTHPRWTDLRIDRAGTRTALASVGHPIAAPTRRICHWSGYLRQGLFPFYRAILAGALPLPVLDRALALAAGPPPQQHLSPGLAAIRSWPA